MLYIYVIYNIQYIAYTSFFVFYRVLARLSCVPNEHLGPICMKTMGDLMRGGELLVEAAAAAVEESIVPLIQVRHTD